MTSSTAVTDRLRVMLLLLRLMPLQLQPTLLLMLPQLLMLLSQLCKRLPSTEAFASRYNDLKHFENLYY
jgi:hypothetical protein